MATHHGGPLVNEYVPVPVPVTVPNLLLVLVVAGALLLLLQVHARSWRFSSMFSCSKVSMRRSYRSRVIGSASRVRVLSSPSVWI